MGFIYTACSCLITKTAFCKLCKDKATKNVVLSQCYRVINAAFCETFFRLFSFRVNNVKQKLN